jgi:spore photoproduct lyase
VTSSSRFYADLIHRVYVEADLAASPRFQALRSRLAHFPVTVLAAKEEIPPRHLNQHTVFICRPRGETVGRCPGSRGHLCCNYLTIDLYLGCPLGCAYCIMKSYLNFAPLTVYLDPEPSIAAITAIAGRNRDRMLRVGSGEVGDSLLLDPLFDLSRELISALAPFPNVYLELKTKTHFVDHLLDIDNKGNTVIGFSLNPQPIIDAYEGIASPLEGRLDAARRALASGYLVSFHFDPIFYSPDWENEYAELLAAVGEFPGERIAWISLGPLRYTPELKDKMGEQDFLLEEYVPCRDGKNRYLQKVRSRIYRSFSERLASACGCPVYMCMESPAVWRNVFGKTPREIPGVRDIFKPARGIK